MKEITADDVIATFAREAALLDDALHKHPLLGAILSKQFTHSSIDQLKTAYCKWLKITEQYVSSTVPMLHAAGEALQNGDTEDKEWSKAFFHYRNEEIDPKEKYGHEIWATQGLKALNAPESIINAQKPPSVKEYGRFFITNASQHPYSILGAKGVLEHLSILNAPTLEDGLRASPIPNIEQAIRFINEHGILDIKHVQEGNQRIRTIQSTEKLSQVLLGAYFTSGSYRAFIESV